MRYVAGVVVGLLVFVAQAFVALMCLWYHDGGGFVGGMSCGDLCTAIRDLGWLLAGSSPVTAIVVGRTIARRLATP